MKCVIAGGSGFLGRALCKRLTSNNHEVVVLTRGAARNDGAVRYVSWPAVDEPGLWRQEINGAAGTDRVLVAIGPEGGWNDFELALLERHGFLRAGLGSRTLTTTSACIAALSLVHEVLAS